MPMGEGKLFLPVKADIRKKIGKKAGDWVKIVLFADNEPTEIPEEFLLCLRDDPTAYKTFLSYTDGEKKEFINWIYSAKTDDGSPSYKKMADCMGLYFSGTTITGHCTSANTSCINSDGNLL
jgi:hypothetical protein